MAAYAELLLGEVARYTVVWERIIRPSGIPIELIAWKQLLAMTSAVGLARPTSSAARITRLLAMKSGSSTPSIIRASQSTAALGSLPRIDLMNAEIDSDKRRVGKVCVILVYTHCL